MTNSNNTLSNQQQYNKNDFLFHTEIKNKGFLLLDEMFKQHGWHLCKNEMNWICYTKFGHETEFFEIRIDPTNVYVSIPMKNSRYQYTTCFKNYFTASEYVEEHFKDFVLEY
jgi:hypothetical protein